MFNAFQKFLLALSLLGLAACGDSAEILPENPQPRPVKTFKVSESADTIKRSFPSVLQPKDSSELSFEVSGQLGAIDLRVGQTVKAGDVLISIDPRSLSLELDRARTDVAQAEALLRNARGIYERQEALLQDGFTTRAAFDAAESDLHAAEAELDSARAQQSLAEENLSKADLVAPFDGTIARINASAFDIVSPGTPVVSIYSSTQFEVLFSVPSTIVNSLSEGNRAIVRVAQRRDLDLDAILTEVGSRTDGSNAFPVTATLINPAAGLKSGMAAEVVLEVPVADGASGFLVPFNALAFDQSSSVDEMAEGTRQARVFKYDPETETVVIQSVTISGVRDNMLIITGGLEIGDRIASAGVSFLSDGQAVTLFETE